MNPTSLKRSRSANQYHTDDSFDMISTLKLLEKPHQVFIYHSAWNFNTLKEGIISLSPSNSHIISYLLSGCSVPSSIKIKSSQAVKIITQKEAADHIKYFLNSDELFQEELSLVLVSEEITALVFQQFSSYEVWLSYLQYLNARSLSSGSIDECATLEESWNTINSYKSFGAIFDISEIDAEDECSREFIVTFLRPDLTCTDSLVIDMGQEGFEINDNVQESLEKNMDLVNKTVLQTYLQHAKREHLCDRMDKREIVKKTKDVPMAGFRDRARTFLNSAEKFGVLNGVSLKKCVMHLIRKVNQKDMIEGDNLDLVEKALINLYMQKMSISYQIHQLSIERRFDLMRDNSYLNFNIKDAIFELTKKGGRKPEESEEAGVKEYQEIRGPCDCVTF